MDYEIREPPKLKNGIPQVVFIEPTLENYNKKKDEIGLKEELTTEKSRKYKDRFPSWTE